MVLLIWVFSIDKKWVFLSFFLLTVWTFRTSPVNSLQFSLQSVISELTIPLGCRLGAPNPISSFRIIWSGNLQQDPENHSHFSFINKQKTFREGPQNDTALNEGIRSESEFREQDVQQGPIHNNHKMNQLLFYETLRLHIYPLGLHLGNPMGKISRLTLNSSSSPILTRFGAALWEVWRCFSRDDTSSSVSP